MKSYGMWYLWEFAFVIHITEEWSHSKMIRGPKIAVWGLAILAERSRTNFIWQTTPKNIFNDKNLIASIQWPKISILGVKCLVHFGGDYSFSDSTLVEFRCCVGFNWSMHCYRIFNFSWITFQEILCILRTTWWLVVILLPCTQSGYF